MSTYDDEIDLRPYILLVLKSWWLIALVVFLAGAVGLAISLLKPRSYEATATLLLTRSRATLSLAQQFPTVNEPVDQRARMDALLSIAQSDALAFSILHILGEKLPGELRQVEELKNCVTFETSGDAILIKASYVDPVIAAEIANNWARQTTQAINQAYGGEQPLADIQSQLQSSQAEYLAAQADLESFIRESKIHVLEKQIEEANAVLANLANERTLRINYYNQRKYLMEDLQLQAEALLQQMKGGSQSEAGDLGDALAVLMTRARLLSLNTPSLDTPTLDTTNPNAPSRAPFFSESNQTVSQNPPNVMLSLTINEDTGLRDTTPNYVADLQGVVTLAKEEREKADAILLSLTEDMLQGERHENFENVAARLSELETQLENERARELNLISQRDLAWKAYQALVEKETDLKSVSQTSNYVSLASVAIPPEKPTSRGTLIFTGAGIMIGLIVSIFMIFVLHWLKSIDQSSVIAPSFPVDEQRGISQ